MAKATAKTDRARPKTSSERGPAARDRASAKSGPDGVAAYERAFGAAKATGVLGGNTGNIDRADRIAAGRALRRDVPRSGHGDWQAAADRPDPVAVLEAQGESRVTELLPIRHGRMAESEFGFFRGAAAGMAADLASTPSTGIMVQLCGDADLVNVGGFATPERRLIFDVNDFDETLPGPWEWDLKRLGASFAVAARSKGLPDEVGQAAVLLDAGLCGPAGRIHDDSHARRLVLEHRYRVGRGDGGSRRRRRNPGRLRPGHPRAHAHNNLQAVNKLTAVVDGRRRIVDQLPLVGHVGGDDDVDRMQSLLDGYRASLPDDVCHLLDRFRLTDAARKVVGVGSVGTRCWIALLEGGGADDPLILQIKEAEASVLEPHLGRSAYDNHARRVVEGQRLMQGPRPVPGLDPRPDLERGLLLAQPARHEGVRRHQCSADELVPQLRGAVWRDHGRGHRRFWRRCGYLRVHRQRRRLRQSPGPLRHFVCRSERTRSCGTCSGDRGRPGDGRTDV